MRQLRRAVVAAAWSAWLAGCAVSAIGMAPDRPDQPWVPTTTATGEIVPGARPSAPSPEAGYVLPANTDLSGLPAPLGLNRSKAYSLPELIDIAQSNNPQTRTAWNDARNAALVAGIAESTYLPRLRATTVGVPNVRSRCDLVHISGCKFLYLLEELRSAPVRVRSSAQ